MDKKIYLIADDREQHSPVIEALSQLPGISISINRLTIGDYLADQRLVFERKTLHDFAVSIIDGRLFRQAMRLTGCRYKPVMILEGIGRDLTRAGVQRHAIQGALISISLIYGIPVLRAMDPAETANLICYTARQMRINDGNGIYRAGYHPKTKSKRQQYILQGLPGIGPQKARALLDKFGSIERIMTANEKELQSVEGIGRQMAEKIRWTVREHQPVYGNLNQLNI
ncbi:MAG: ERCC4 domain-containing protein [Thermodesulfobacteriota bacterium]|nr:ERCC4 domain-containing protein [Thermodesulfobacteriota bacterium]